MRLILATLLALLVVAAPAAGQVRTIAQVHTPDRGGRTAFPVIDALHGHLVWSDYDAAIDAWRLMAHVRGATRALPIAPRRTPFDVDLGLDRRGRMLAVYSRCARGLRHDMPTPQSLRAARYGCALYSYSFASGRETALADASSHADEYWPAMSHGRVAFVRAYRSRRDCHGAFALRYSGFPGLPGSRAPWASEPSKAVAFARDFDIVYFIDAGPRAGFDPVWQPGGTFALMADYAPDYRRVPRSWLPIRPPR
jgi:hypothetical protein